MTLPGRLHVRVSGAGAGNRHPANEWADKVGSLVTAITGATSVICVLAFRRGIVGESLALQRRMIGQKTQGRVGAPATAGIQHRLPALAGMPITQPFAAVFPVSPPPSQQSSR